jgi:diguanylate cyclase (GGDEF)-like protein
MTAMRNSLVRSVATNPKSTIQDAMLAVCVLAVGLLLAVEFDLFQFAHELTTQDRQISLLEAIALTVLLAACIIGFVVRRIGEQRADQARDAEAEGAIQELRNQAMRDELTGLPNRRALFVRLNQLKSSEGNHAFFLLDINGFKQVNDRHGHAAGDSVLLIIAERFSRVARPTDLLARLGGDEFAVLAHDIDYLGAEAAGQRYIQALDTGISVNGITHKIGVAVGAVLIPEGCVNVAEILANADAAMYRAKAEGGSALVFYGDIKRRQDASFG